MNPTKFANGNNLFSFLQTAAPRFGWILLPVSLLAVYLLMNFVSADMLTSDANVYFLQPLLWLTVTIVSILVWSMREEKVAFFDHPNLIRAAAMIGIIQIAVGILFGLFTGFGNSPYAHTLWMIPLNLWFITTRLIGIETARWYMGKTVGKINPVLGFFIAWLVPLVLSIPINRFSQLSQPESAFNFAGLILLPAMASNLLAAYLAITAGPLASLSYLGLMQAFEWFCPILPDLPLMATALIGVIVPIFSLVALNQQETSPAVEAVGEPAKKEKSAQGTTEISWLVLAALAVGMIWLNSGALGVRPSLISGNSMNPVLYTGDIVVTQSIPVEKIQVGDMIRFRKDGIDVVHRVKEVQLDGSATTFITRGDNNNVDDNPVLADQVQGKVVLTLPKIGWIGIYIRLALNWVGGLL